MNPALEFLLFVLAALALGFTVLWILHWLRAEDAAAGVVIDPWTPDPGPPTALVYLRRCAWCAQLQGPAVTLQPGQRFTITDGLCPPCERRHFPPAATAGWQAHIPAARRPTQSA